MLWERDRTSWDMVRESNLVQVIQIVVSVPYLPDSSLKMPHDESDTDSGDNKRQNMPPPASL